MKRGLLASAVASILFAGTVAGLGSFDEGESSGVPMPGPGASARYAVTDLEAESGVREILMQWNAPEQIHDSSFGLRNAWRLDMDIVMDGSAKYRSWATFDASNGRGIHDSQENERGAAYPGILGPTAAETNLAFDIYIAQIGPCGVADGWRIDPSADQILLQGHCQRWSWDTDAVYEKVGDLAYRSVDDERFQVAYEAGNPFPTRLTVPLQDMIFHLRAVNAMVQLELVEWQGAPPYDAMAGLESPGLGPVPLRPWTDHGLDDSDVEHPFPLSQAYAAAINYGGSERVADFLAAHPSAFLSSAWGATWIDGSGNEHHNWWMTWTDGTDWIAKRVVERPAGWNGLTINEAPRQVSVIANRPPDATLDALPDPSMRPAGLPDPAETIQRHKAFTDSDQTRNRYGFSVSCFSGCSEPTVIAAGGWFFMDRLNENDFLLMANQATDGALYDYDQIMLNGDGTLRYSERQKWTTQPVIAPLQSDQPDESDGSSSASWRSPTTAAVASAGLFAVLGGLLVYLAPLAKIPAVALFSRIRGDHLLEHPTRAAIVTAVQAEPGIHFQDLSRRLDLGKSTLDHHLRKLVDAKHLRVKISPGYTCYFPRKTDRAVMAAAPFLRAPGPRKILETVVHGDVNTVAAIARKTGLSTSTVSHHLGRMKDAGLVAGGGRAGFTATSKAQHVV